MQQLIGHQPCTGRGAPMVETLFWEECLIRIEQWEKEFAALQVTRLRLTQTPMKKQSE